MVNHIKKPLSSSIPRVGRPRRMHRIEKPTKPVIQSAATRFQLSFLMQDQVELFQNFISSVMFTAATTFLRLLRLKEALLEKPVVAKVAKEPENCVICTDEMNLKKWWKLWECSTCNQKYHCSCINKWVIESSQCPTCRARILAHL